MSESQINDDRFNLSVNSYKENDFEIMFKIFNPTPERLMQNEINFNLIDSNNNQIQYSAIRSFGNVYKANLSRGDDNLIELNSKRVLMAMTQLFSLQWQIIKFKKCHFIK